MKVGPIPTSFFLLLILIHSMEYPMKYNYTTDYNHPYYYSGNIFTSNRYGRYRILGKLLNHCR